MVFDGKESWQSRRKLIDQAREMAAPRAALLSAAADSLQAEAEALAQATAAAERGDYSRTQTSIQSARDAGCAVQRLVDLLAGVIADLSQEQGAFAAEIFGDLEPPMRNQDGGKYPLHKHECKLGNLAD